MPENILKVFKRDSSEVSFKMLFDTKKKKKKQPPPSQLISYFHFQ